MAQLGATFDPSQVNDDRQVLPEGEYILHVIESDVVPTKNGEGTLAKLTYEVVDGPLAKRRIWDQMTIQHSNAQAQEIGQRSLKRLCEAVGLGPITETDSLHFRPFRGSVRIEKGQGGYDDKNVVKGFKSMTAPSGGGQSQDRAASNEPTQQAQPQQQHTTQQQTASGGGSRPWQR